MTSRARPRVDWVEWSWRAGGPSHVIRPIYISPDKSTVDGKRTMLVEVESEESESDGSIDSRAAVVRRSVL